MSTTLLLLDSRDKQNGSTNAEPSFRLDSERITNRSFRISLQSCTIPNLEFPIGTYNNTVIFAEGGGSNLSATITPGLYTGSEFATELKTILDAAGALTYTVTYSSITGRITIAPTTSTVQLKTTNAAFTAAYVMGFNDKTDTADAASITGDYVVRLDGSRFIDIEISGIGQTVSSKNTSQPIARVPITAPFGSIVYYEMSESSQSQFVADSQLLSNLQFRLRNEYGRTLELEDTAYCNFTLLLKPL